MGKINLDDYVPVSERLQQAKEAIQVIASDPPMMLTDVMGFIRVTVQLKEGRSANGTASFRLDLDGRSAQATNPIEDCETSAIGRALALLGYESTRGIASREEVREAVRRSDAQPQSAGAGPLCPGCEKPSKPSKYGGFYCYDCRQKVGG